jgi:mono/diheme cytochrome c family protein
MCNPGQPGNEGARYRHSSSQNSSRRARVAVGFLPGVVRPAGEGVMKICRLLVGAIIVVASAVVTVDAQAQAPEPYSGSEDYQTYCAACHGAGARGDGPIGKLLKTRPADLTELSKRNNNLFPSEAVFKTIDGHKRGSAIKNTDMPVWGDVFANAIESAGSKNAAVRIDVLVKYLQTLQTK